MNRCVKTFTRDAQIFCAVWGFLFVIFPCLAAIVKVAGGQANASRTLLLLPFVAAGILSWLLIYRSLKSREICLSERGIAERGWFSRRREILWGDVDSVHQVEHVQSLNWIKHADPLVSIIVTSKNGQTIKIPVVGSDIEEIKHLLHERLPEQTWQ